MAISSVKRGWVPADTFGARLALVRQHYGWNVKEAALTCGLPVQSWRGWERDNMKPRDYLNICQRIAEATGADYDWLLDGRRPPGDEVRHQGLEPRTRWFEAPTMRLILGGRAA